MKGYRGLVSVGDAAELMQLGGDGLEDHGCSFGDNDSTMWQRR